METELRKTGIEVIGDVAWGTHFCHFYETRDDLLDILVPYIKAGLENGEFCLLVIPEYMTEEETRMVLRQAVPDLDRYLAEGSLEIFPAEEWYLKGGVFDFRRIIKSLYEKLDQVLARGGAGMRFFGDVDWLQKRNLRDFRAYESEFNKLNGGRRLITLCPFPLASTRATEVFDAARAHQIVIAKREGHWETLETPGLKQAKAEIKMLSEELEQRVVERTRQLAATNEELMTEIIERKRVEEENRKLLHELTERVKEVTALHGAMRILQQGRADTPTGLRKLVSLLPSAFQYPEITAARIRVGQIEAVTHGFAASPATLRAEFTTGDKQPGSIEVIYTEDRPPAAEGPFLAEEREFLNTLADMLRTFYDRQQAEKQLRATGEQLRALSQNLDSAREEEGMRIARELHDELGSALTSLKWDLESIDKLCSDAHDKFDFSTLQEKVKVMVEIIDSTINSVRRISSELRPSILDDLGLVAALEWQAQQFEARTGIDCRFDSLLESIDLGREQATAIFRIFQEALTNILRHAQATRVSILIEEEEGEFVLKVEDNGRGITEEEKTGPRSLGLIGMRERARLAGGRLEITGIAGKGTTLTLRVPLNSLSSNNQP